MSDKPAGDKPEASGENDRWLRELIASNEGKGHQLAELRAEVRRLGAMLDGPEAETLRAARAALIRELAALLPKAVREARRGKPALLRLIARTLRLK